MTNDVITLAERVINRLTSPNDGQGTLPWILCQNQLLSASEVRDMTNEELEQRFPTPDDCKKALLKAHSRMWSARAYYRFDDHRATWITTAGNTGDALLWLYPPATPDSREITIAHFAGEREQVLNQLDWLAGQDLPVYAGVHRQMHYFGAFAPHKPEDMPIKSRTLDLPNLA